MKNKRFTFLKKPELRGIQSIIMLAFAAISVFIMLILGVLLYLRFSDVSRQQISESTQKLVDQTDESLEDYLGSIRQISDTLYYNIIKENELSGQDNSIQQGMNLIYEANSDSLKSIAIYNYYGSLITAEPIVSQKENPDVTKQEWFGEAMEKIENMHFSTPHIQNLFDDDAFRYYWVISLSRAVELTVNGDSQFGVLLVDMDYSKISHIMKKINTYKNGQYFYLCDKDGNIIYHPRQVQIGNGICAEDSEVVAGYKDGIYDTTFEGEPRKVVVNTISYTGWKLVGVIPAETFSKGMVNMRYFIAIIMLVMAMMLVVINRVVAVKISSPILKLNDSVMKYEAGDKAEIYVSGPREVRHLAQSIETSYEQNALLMDRVIQEQNERRRSELDALQSQINPHFLYNTLESLTWMIEAERNDDAVFMVSELAKLFRISLSKGFTIISIADELQHARSYMNIQKIRYKNKFNFTCELPQEILDCCTVKLILQPILENAINYGISSMDDCGEIKITGTMEEHTIVLSVSDNGIGIPQEDVELLLTDNNRVHKHGSGVGLINVNNRIQILFGKEYGLVIESEPDLGTTVSVRIPQVPFTEENRKILEKGNNNER